MAFIGKQRTFKYIQINNASRETIFPLLCPVREADWVDGWQYELIHSKSGFAEQDCVFSTPINAHTNAIWQITQYNPNEFELEFIKFIPEGTIVKINICLEPIAENITKSIISYQYTALNEEHNNIIETSQETSFKKLMEYWENAINHYLNTGKKLLKD